MALDKVVDSALLDGALTATADAIREKTGGSDLIPWDATKGFADVVSGIEAGGGFPNGTEWTQCYHYGGNRIVHANGLWVMGGAKGAFYSENGKNWKDSGCLFGLGIGVEPRVSNIAYADGVWVASARRGLYYSVDGKSWTQTNHVFSTDTTFSLIYNFDGKWIAIRSDNSITVSENGKVWSEFVAVTNKINDILYFRGMWIVATDSGIQHTKSLDNVEWIASNNTVKIHKLYYADGVIVAVGSGIYYSIDGVTWTNGASTYGRMYNEVHKGNGMWVAMGGSTSGNNGTPSILYSVDGKNWQDTGASPFACSYNPLFDRHFLAYANGVWVAMNSSKNKLVYSFDCVSWYDALSDVFNDIVYADGVWVACTANKLYHSVTWEPTE